MVLFGVSVRLRVPVSWHATCVKVPLHAVAVNTCTATETPAYSEVINSLPDAGTFTLNHTSLMLTGSALPMQSGFGMAGVSVAFVQLKSFDVIHVCPIGSAA